MGIERPDVALWHYYLLRCLAIPPLFPILVLPFYFRYHTMRYRFDEEGISMRWGILFRHETILNYARIQDIHLRSNILERWLGLARIQVQTASGSSTAELTIEGIKEFEAVRDFLYSRMRGVKDAGHHASVAQPELGHAPHQNPDAALSELAGLLRETASEVRGLRKAIEDQKTGSGQASPHV
jgi:putative membrane protein